MIELPRATKGAILSERAPASKFAHPQKEQKFERGAYVIELDKGIKQIDLVGKK